MVSGSVFDSFEGKNADSVLTISLLDYGASSYIGPIEGDQPHSQAWVNGYPHLGFLDMTSYYAEAYKSGVYPVVSNDKVYIWSRPHPKDANIPQDSVGRPTHAEWVSLSPYRSSRVLTGPYVADGRLPLGTRPVHWNGQVHLELWPQLANVPRRRWSQQV
jgi:Glycosyl hydrolase family 71